MAHFVPLCPWVIAYSLSVFSFTRTIHNSLLELLSLVLGIPTCVPSVELKPGKLSDGKPISTVTKEDYPARKKKGTKPKKQDNTAANTRATG